MISSLSTRAHVEYHPQVIDAATGALIADYGIRRNLIPDAGLNSIMTRPAYLNNRWLLLGTGALVVKRGSGATTITAASGTLTASASFFTAADVGRVLKLNSGQEYRITGYTSGTVAASTNTTSAAASAGTIHYVELTGLVAEDSASSTRESGPAFSYDTGLNQITQETVHLGPILASGSKTITEMGWGFDNGGGGWGGLFGLAAVSPSVSIGAGQRVRVRVRVVCTIGPIGPLSLSGSGLATGSHGIAQINTSSIEALLSVVFPEQYGTRSAGVNNNTAAITAPALGSGGVGFLVSTSSINLAAYVAGSFTRSASWSIPDTAGAATFRSVYFEAGGSHYRALLSATATKAATDRIDGTITWTVGRTLVN